MGESAWREFAVNTLRRDEMCRGQNIISRTAINPSVRSMRGTAVIVSLVLASSFFVTVAVTPARASGEKPNWSVGDYWEYEWRFGYPLPWMNWTQRWEVTAFEDVTVAGTTYPSVRVSKSTEMGYYSSYFNWTEKWWHLSTDLSMLRIDAFGTDAYGAGHGMNITYNPPLDFYQFPIALGEEWTARSTPVIDKTGNLTPYYVNNVTHKVASIVDVTVALNESGTVIPRQFRCYTIRETFDVGDSYYLYHYSDEVGNWVKQEAWAKRWVGSDYEWYEVFESRLTKFNYASPPPDPAPVPYEAVAVVVAAGAVATAAALTIKRRRRITKLPSNQIESELPPPP